MAKLPNAKEGVYKVADMGQVEKGKESIYVAARKMPVTSKILRERFAKEKPLKGLKIAGCLHITKETANLAITLMAGGAEVLMCGSNPLSTQDDTAAAMVDAIFSSIDHRAVQGRANSLRSSG